MRMTRTTSVCVASNSINHPVRGWGHQTAKPDVTGSETLGLQLLSFVSSARRRLVQSNSRISKPPVARIVRRSTRCVETCYHFFSHNLYEMQRRVCAGVGHKHESRVSRRPGLPGSSGWLGVACFALAAIFRRVVLARFLGVIGGVQMLPVRNVGVMPSLFRITGFVMFGRFTMMMRGKLVMLGCALVMLRAFVFRHY